MPALKDAALLHRIFRHANVLLVIGAGKCPLIRDAERRKAERIVGLQLANAPRMLDRFAEQAALQWLSAFASRPRLVLGQVHWDSGGKAGEIAAAQRLIKELGLTDKLYTLDALHCQKNSAPGHRRRQ